MTVYRILTLNLKTDLPFTRGQRLFSHRIHSIEEMIRWHDPDLIGVQELTEEMLQETHGRDAAAHGQAHGDVYLLRPRPQPGRHPFR